MLGEEISDPLHMEGGGRIAGMGLLPMDTCFGQEKIRTRVRGRILNIEGMLQNLSSVSVEGYEIHMGHTTLHSGACPFCMLTESISGEEKTDGCQAGNVYGTYLHGIFDEGEMAGKLIYALGKAKGIDLENTVPIDLKAYKQMQYDRLAQEIRMGLDIHRVYERMGLK